MIMPSSFRHLNITVSDVDRLHNSDSKQLQIPPRKAKVVICGGGVMGAAVAYQLAQSGLGTETVIVEQAAYVMISPIPIFFI